LVDYRTTHTVCDTSVETGSVIVDDRRTQFA
jgi:hypothetical protein